MRMSLVLAILLSVTTILGAQPDKNAPQPRYGIAPNLPSYPQATGKETLNSAIRAIEREKYDYLAAHLLDPKFIDTRVSDRAKYFEKSVDAELRELRERQRKDPDFPPKDQLPSAPEPFAELVRTESQQRAFRYVVRDIRQHLTENPEYLKDFKRFLRDGQFTDAGETANSTLRDLKTKQLNFKKAGTRWYLEDRQGIELPERK